MNIKKSILTLFFVLLALISIAMFFHSKDMVSKYNAGFNLSLDCDKLTKNYEEGSVDIDFSNEITFENWQFCIAKDGHQFFILSKIISLPIAIVFIILALYIRKLEIRLSTRSLLLIVLSPLMLLFIFGLGNSVYDLSMNYKNGEILFKNPKQVESIMNNIFLIGFIFLIAVIKIFIKFVKKQKQPIDSRNK